MFIFDRKRYLLRGHVKSARKAARVFKSDLFPREAGELI